jgi:hypothetical protein
MALSAQLEALTVPFGTEFPPTVQALLELIAQYESITGLEDFSGISFGDTEPDPADRDKPWFKTDNSGNPLGWFAWNGSVWAPIPTSLPTGVTNQRPATPTSGQLFFDTEINVALIFERGEWRTISGSPGDVKEVTAASIDDALTNNPGWSEYSDGAGRVIVGVTTGSGFAYGDTGGAAEVTLTTPQLPAHTHTVPTGGNKLQADGNAANPAGIVSGVSASVTGSTGDGEAHNNMMPYLCLFRIVKD